MIDIASQTSLPTIDASTNTTNTFVWCEISTQTEIVKSISIQTDVNDLNPVVKNTCRPPSSNSSDDSAAHARRQRRLQSLQTYPADLDDSISWNSKVYSILSQSNSVKMNQTVTYQSRNPASIQSTTFTCRERPQPNQFGPGDTVIIRHSKYDFRDCYAIRPIGSGPFTVIGQIAENKYAIRDCRPIERRDVKRPKRIVSGCHLKQFHPNFVYDSDSEDDIHEHSYINPDAKTCPYDPNEFAFERNFNM